MKTSRIEAKNKIAICGDRNEPLIVALQDIMIKNPAFKNELCKVIDLELWDNYSMSIYEEYSPEIDSWDVLNKYYPENREYMSEVREREFVNHCFSLYEKEGFASKFWTPFSQYEKYIGKSFSVIRRCSENTDEIDLEILPVWKIKFEDGEEIFAYSEEIIPSEMKANGCKMNL